MHPIDWIIVAIFMAFLLWLGFKLSKKAGSSTTEYILAGRKMPWWLAGTSYTATGLNASTMLQDSRKIRQDGIAGLWFTWQNIPNMAIATVWFFRLWRRAGYVTQMEFYRDRYTGWRADFARLFDTVFYGICIGAGWAAIGLVGMKKIISVILDLPETVQFLGLSLQTDVVIVLSMVAIALVYSAASGVHGVVWTDMVEFAIAMMCSIGLTLIVYNVVGWNSGLHEKIQGMGARGDELLQLTPAFGIVLLYYFFIHPIFTQGGYNPHVQRFLALKNERETVYMVIYSNLINFVLKPFPFYVCGLASIFIFTDEYILAELGSIVSSTGEVIPDYERVYPALVKQYLPIGITGLMIAGFMSAFMSSFDTNIHNAASTFTNDLYRGYLAKDKTEEHYVWAARWFMVFQTVFASIIGIMVDDILALMMIGIALPIAPGMVKLARFIWWRVNGWAEVIAQITSVFVIAFVMSPWGRESLVWLMDQLGVSGNDGFFVTRQLVLILFSTLISLVVVLLTKPEPMDRLVAFYKRVRPYGWWDPVIAQAGEKYRNRESRIALVSLTLGITGSAIGAIFAAIGFILARWELVWPFLGLSAVAGTVCHFALKNLYPIDGETEIVE
ncbi:MAG: Na+:solute symporter [Synoicihabitans sp.]